MVYGWWFADILSVFHRIWIILGCLSILNGFRFVFCLILEKHCLAGITQLTPVVYLTINFYYSHVHIVCILFSFNLFNLYILVVLLCFCLYLAKQYLAGRQVYSAHNWSVYIYLWSMATLCQFMQFLYFQIKYFFLGWWRCCTPKRPFATNSLSLTESKREYQTARLNDTSCDS